jgi:hypothetical protein
MSQKKGERNGYSRHYWAMLISEFSSSDSRDGIQAADLSHFEVTIEIDPTSVLGRLLLSKLSRGRVARLKRRIALAEFGTSSHSHSRTPPSEAVGGPQSDIPTEDQRSYDRIIPLAKLKRQAIFSALAQTRGDRLLAARLLGIGRTTLYRKLRGYELESSENTSTAESSTRIPVVEG